MKNTLSENSLDNTIAILLQHCKNKEKFKKDAFKITTGREDSKDYTNKGIRRSRFSQKDFIKSIFINSAAAGSNFVSCTFDNCKIINANFQECTFADSHLINYSKENAIVHSNFNESLFTDDFSVENTYFKHSVFYKTAFIKGTIKNTTFYSCTLEDTIFSDIVMEKVQFTDLNIDYAVFEHVQMKNVILPFSQICYTFGLLPYLENTKDEVYITSVANENGYISKEEFLSLIPHFIEYYTETKDFFPLANIYFFLGENEKAKNVIKAGILVSVTECDFRRIKYLCKLISVYSVFNFHERKEIYDYIYSHISFYDMHPGLLYSYKVYQKEIEGYLINNNRSDVVTATINITTNVFPDDAVKLGILLSCIEEVIDIYKSPQGEHKLLCFHNSAESLKIILQEILPALMYIIPAIYYVLMGTLNLEEKRLNVKKEKINLKVLPEQKQLESEKNRLELASQQLEIEREKIALEKNKIELYNLQAAQFEKQNQIKREILRENITNHDVEITEINHIMIGNIPPQIDRQLIQFSTKNLKG